MSDDKILQYNKKYLLEVPNDDEIKKFGRRYVKLLITDKATSGTDIAKYIQKKWKAISLFLNIQNRRTRKPQYQDLIQHLYTLNKLPIKELRNLLKLLRPEITYKIKYKTDIIAKILRLNGKDPSERVKKLLHRHKNHIGDR